MQWLRIVFFFVLIAFALEVGEPSTVFVRAGRANGLFGKRICAKEEKTLLPRLAIQAPAQTDDSHGDSEAPTSDPSDPSDDVVSHHAELSHHLVMRFDTSQGVIRTSASYSYSFTSAEPDLRPPLSRLSS